MYLITFWSCLLFSSVICDVSVEIFTDRLLNIVSDKFISFTLDSNLLLNDSDPINSDECLCMAKSLSPAYIRIAGPSIRNISVENSILKLRSSLDKKLNVMPDQSSPKGANLKSNLMTSEQFVNFMEWIHEANFTPFVTINSGNRLLRGNWNPTTAIRVLSIADEIPTNECVWQLSNECKSQSSMKYLNDLKTFKLLMDAFASGRNGKWKLSSADVLQCSHASPKEELRSFLSMANNFLDAVVLNSDPDVEVLDIFDEREKMRIRNEYKNKNTQLWKTTDVKVNGAAEKAVAWLKTLGNAARNGYSVVFKNLEREDLGRPNLSYYVSLLHKMLAGPRVLEISKPVGVEGVSMFAHCAKLPGGPLSNGVTIFAANSASQKRSISIDLEVKTYGGEIMQYVLYENPNGKIIINGHQMMNEADIEPVVKKVRPFRVLTVSLPPKSVGFWVISNANIELCLVNDDSANDNVLINLNHKQLQSDITAEVLQQIVQDNSLNENNIRRRRDINDNEKEQEMNFEFGNDQSVNSNNKKSEFDLMDREFIQSNIHNEVETDKNRQATDEFNQSNIHNGITVDQTRQTTDEFNQSNIHKKIKTDETGQTDEFNKLNIHNEIKTNENRQATNEKILKEGFNNDLIDMKNLSEAEFQSQLKKDGDENNSNNISEKFLPNSNDAHLEVVNKPSDLINIDRDFINAKVPDLEMDQVAVLVAQAEKKNQVNNMEDLSIILSQLTSLIELQEEFLDIGSTMFQLPSKNNSEQFEHYPEEMNLDLLMNNQEISPNVFENKSEVILVRSTRSIDLAQEHFTDEDQLSDDLNMNNSTTDLSSQNPRLTREVPMRDVRLPLVGANANADAHQPTSLVLENLKNKILSRTIDNKEPKLFLKNFTIPNFNFTRRLASKLHNSKNIQQPLASAPMNVEEGIAIPDVEDISNVNFETEQEKNTDGSEFTSNNELLEPSVASTDLKPEKELKISDMVKSKLKATIESLKSQSKPVERQTNDFDNDESNLIQPSDATESESEFDEEFKLPTVPSVPEIPTLPPIFSQLSIPQLPNLSQLSSIPQLPTIPQLPMMAVPEIPKIKDLPSLDNLVQRAQDLLRKVNPKTDSAILESRTQEARIATPPIGLLPAFHGAQLSANLQRNRLRMQELRNKMEARLAQIRARQLVSSNLQRHVLNKRSLESSINFNNIENSKNKQFKKIDSQPRKGRKDLRKGMKYMNKSEKNKLQKLKKVPRLYGDLYGSKKFQEIQSNYLRRKRHISSENALRNEIFNIDDDEMSNDIEKLDNTNKNTHIMKVKETKHKTNQTENNSVDQTTKNQSVILEVECDKDNEVDGINESNRKVSNDIKKKVNFSESGECRKTIVNLSIPGLKDAKQEKLTMDEVKTKMGVTKDSMVDVIVDSLTGFFRESYQKIKDLVSKNN